MNCYQKVKFRIGMWMCRRGWHKIERFVGVDWAARGSMVAQVDYCQRCYFTTLVDINGTDYKKVLEQIRNSNLNAILSCEEVVKKDKEARAKWGGEPDPIADMVNFREKMHREAEMVDGEDFVLHECADCRTGKYLVESMIPQKCRCGGYFVKVVR